MKTLRKGFTLVEMLIVIVIIGILAAALIPRLTGAQDQARDTARLADLNQMGTSLAVFNADNANYPVTSTGNASVSLSGLVTNGYIKSIPTDPRSSATLLSSNAATTNGSYAYATIANGSNFVVAADTSVLKKGNIISGANTTTAITASATLTSVIANIVAGSSITVGDSMFVYAN